MIFQVSEKPGQVIFAFWDLVLGFGLKTMSLLNLKGKFATW